MTPILTKLTSPGGTSPDEEKDTTGTQIPMTKVWNFWDYYNKQAKAYDVEQERDWNTNMDVLLIFTALFSAIVAAFLIENMKLLESSSQDTLVNIMLVVSAQLRDPSTEAATVPHFQPPRHAVAINVLLLSSLLLNLVAALAAMLVKQWVHEYDRGLSQTGSAEGRARTRQLRHNGVLYWRMPEIIAMFPMLLHLALALFLIAVNLICERLHPVMQGVTLAALAFSIAFYFGTIMITTTSCSSPFRTPISRMLVLMWRFIAVKYSHRRWWMYGEGKKPTKAAKAWELANHTTFAYWESRKVKRSRPLLNASAIVWLSNNVSIGESTRDTCWEIIREVVALPRPLSGAVSGAISVDIPWKTIINLVWPIFGVTTDVALRVTTDAASQLILLFKLLGRSDIEIEVDNKTSREIQAVCTRLQSAPKSSQSNANRPHIDVEVQLRSVPISIKGVAKASMKLDWADETKEHHAWPSSRVALDFLRDNWFLADPGLFKDSLMAAENIPTLTCTRLNLPGLLKTLDCHKPIPYVYYSVIMSTALQIHHGAEPTTTQTTPRYLVTAAHQATCFNCQEQFMQASLSYLWSQISFLDRSADEDLRSYLECLEAFWTAGFEKVSPHNRWSNHDMILLLEHLVPIAGLSGVPQSKRQALLTAAACMSHYFHKDRSAGFVCNKNAKDVFNALSAPGALAHPFDLAPFLTSRFVRDLLTTPITAGRTLRVLGICASKRRQLAGNTELDPNLLAEATANRNQHTLGQSLYDPVVPDGPVYSDVQNAIEALRGAVDGAKREK